MVEYIGFGAAFLGTFCWMPQTWKTWRTRETKDLSLWGNLMILGTVTLWLAYGILLGSWPLIIANIISILFLGAIVVAKLIYK